MCGIVGYLGKNDAYPVLLDGLKRLEYRGYDSSGIAVINQSKVNSEKAVGKIKELEERLAGKVISGHIGIAHTRWATHGEPNLANAHPHTDCHHQIWLVHNGIIENYQTLKKELVSRGHIFLSDTDTEILAHLIEECYQGDLLSAVKKVLKQIRGAFGLVIMHVNEPDKLIAVRLGSPLLIGLGVGEKIVASDASAIVRYTNQVIYLNDGEVAEIKKDDLKIYDFDYNEVDKQVQKIEWNVEQAEKNGYPHFMIKEIFEQPVAIIESLRGRCVLETGKVKLGGLEQVIERLRKIERINIVACGTARHVGMIGKYMIEEYAGIPVEVDYASEFRYRKPVLGRNTAVIAISQSGETADTLAAVREAKEKNILTIGIVNVVGSTIARETDAGVYNHIGPEISVASTKAFTSQVTILALLTVLFGRQRQMSLVTGQRIVRELLTVPEKIKKILELDSQIKDIAGKYSQVKHFAYLGRKYNQPVALEGALKLKELSYIHAEGFASGEMKHGAIALIDEAFPSLFIAPLDSVYEKNLSNMQEIKSRKGKIIAVATAGDNEIKNIADDIIYIPKTLEMLTPILSVIPLQLFAYHMAVLNSRDVDQPRNLAKSVTVE